MDFLFGILGIIGGMLCACGDLLLDWKGKDNQKLGKYKLIESHWEKMPLWRFKGSVLLAMAGVPLYALGLASMGSQLRIRNEVFGQAFWYVSLFGSIGGFFIHALLCAMPPVYQILMKKSGFPLAEEVINRIFDVVKIPFFLMYVMLVVVTSLMIAYGVWARYLLISPFLPQCGALRASAHMRRMRIPCNTPCLASFFILPSPRGHAFAPLIVVDR